MKIPLSNDLTAEQKDALQKVNELGGIVLDGEVYLSIKGAAIENGLDYKTLQQRLYRGWAVYDALHLPPMEGRLIYKEKGREYLEYARAGRYYYNGSTYRSLADLSRSLNLNQQKLSYLYRAYNGDLEKAIAGSHKTTTKTAKKPEAIVYGGKNIPVLCRSVP